MNFLKNRWNKFALFSILLQFVLTVFQIKFFPFSDHGIFQHYREIKGQKYYRIKEKISDNYYIEENILYTNSIKIKNLINKGVPKKSWKKNFKFPLGQIDEFELTKDPMNDTVLYRKKTIWPQEVPHD